MKALSAWGAVYRAQRKTDKRSLWINQLAQRRGKNRTCVAVANKNVRIIWALLTKEMDYQKAA